MAQCEKYPIECMGMVKRDSIDGKWYCTRHFGDIEHLRATGRHK